MAIALSGLRLATRFRLTLFFVSITTPGLTVVSTEDVLSRPVMQLSWKPIHWGCQGFGGTKASGLAGATTGTS